MFQACNQLLLYLVNGGTAREEFLGLITRDVEVLPDCDIEIKKEIYFRRKVLTIYCSIFIMLAFVSFGLVVPHISYGKLLMPWMTFIITKTGKFSVLFKCFNMLCFLVYCYMFTFFIIYLVHVYHFQAIYTQIWVANIFKKLKEESQQEHVIFKNLIELANFIAFRRK